MKLFISLVALSAVFLCSHSNARDEAGSKRKPASELPSNKYDKRDCSVAINFNHGTDKAGKILKARGFKGSFANEDLDAAQAEFRLQGGGELIGDVPIKSKSVALVELQVIGPTGDIIWTSGTHPCKGASLKDDRFAFDVRCNDEAVEKIPKCANGLLMID